MYRLLPILLALAITPDSDKRMDELKSIIQATGESIASIKNGMDTFHSAATPLMTALQQEMSGYTGQPAGGVKEKIFNGNFN